MAKTLKSYEFSHMGGSRKGAYDQYLDGQIWVLTLDDAPIGTTIRGMQSSIAGAGRRRNLKVRTQIERDHELNADTGEMEVMDERLIVQALPIEETDEDE